MVREYGTLDLTPAVAFLRRPAASWEPEALSILTALILLAAAWLMHREPLPSVLVAIGCAFALRLTWAGICWVYARA